MLPGLVARPSSTSSVSTQVAIFTSDLTEVSDELPLSNDVLRLEWAVHGESVPASTLPPDLCNPATSDLEQATRGLFVRVAAEEADQRGDVLLLDGFYVRSRPSPESEDM